MSDASTSSRYFITSDTQMPMENIMASPLYAETLDDCAQLCDQHNTNLHGATDQPGYSYQRCNGFVYDTHTKQCTLKNKRMGNMTTQEGPHTRGFYDPNKNTPRYYSGYRWRALTNEINDVFPNAMSGMQGQRVGGSQAMWSEDYGVHGSFCTDSALSQSGRPKASRLCADNHVRTKDAEYDVRPGAIFSASNRSAQDNRYAPLHVTGMSTCADICSKTQGCNAFTFWPEYTTATATSDDQSKTPGICVVGNVREPYYQTLTPGDNGAISGFALTALSRENHRFLFG